MKTEVTETGVLIPPQFLEGVKEVEIRRESNMILVIPLLAEDPIFELGQNPATTEDIDASANHDLYLYS